jgi:hypothetical protein
MEENNDSITKASLKERINYIMDTVGLEIAGFSELTKISESHLYALSNGTKSLTKVTAEKIAFPLKLKSTQILNLNYVISDSIRNAPAIKKFYHTFKKGNPEYFRDTKAARKSSYFIEQELMPSGLFNEPVYVWQVKEACVESGMDYSSKEISQKLSYLVKTNKLKSEKRKLKKKNGDTADREVFVYYSNKKME